MAGRPTFKPTRAQRRRVMLMVGETSEEIIARLIGISPPTLRKHFHEELEHGRARVLMENLERLDRQARKGNTSATKALVARKDLVPPEGSSPKPPAQDAAGKKEAAATAAQTAEQGTGWSDLVH